ncbi:MAG: ABC transporter ATP-binding protein [Burkholderiales bacterium]|nr:ABC transporter ATP-binding protein [Burkholderiales bacterium]
MADGAGLGPASPAAAAATAARGAIELRGVTKRYGDERVVDSLSLAVAPGEFFSLLGPSGSGKTTTLMMLAGFTEVDEGEIRIDGRDIAGTPAQRRGLGMVFQNYAVFPHMNVFDNIAFPLRARGMARSRIEAEVARALDLVQLARHAGKYARELSGGQQQRVAIARAIVYSPPVVLMDEPLGALDKNLRYDMQAEIKDIQRRLGMTVIYVTHDQEEALNMSDRIAILDRGRIAQLGRPGDVYERPVDRFVAQFLGEANLIEGRVLACEGGLAQFGAAGGFEVSVPAAQGWPAGGAALLFVRPEKLVLCAAGEARLHARVHRRSFLGGVIRYELRVGEAIELKVDVANSAYALRPEPGETVGLRWREADLSLLPVQA